MEYEGVPHGPAVVYGALGFLNESPMHGYEIRKQLRQGLGALWRIASSQLYSILHRLEAKGWISCCVEPQDGRPSRKVYSITPQGEQAFRDWASSPAQHVRDLRLEFLAKAYFLRRQNPEGLPALLDAQILVLETLREKLAGRERIESNDAGLGELVLRFRRSQLDNAIDWLNQHRSGFLLKEAKG